MTMRMLIDARHREETRVAVTKGNRIEEFDFESAEHKQLKGNIYLAKVTRVEPSLQAAFIEYGGNRHGFLAFSEIHPDYYQIPKEDREALLREEAEHAAEAAMRAEEDMDSLEGDVEDMSPPQPLDDNGYDNGDSHDGEHDDRDGDHDGDGESDGESEDEDHDGDAAAENGDGSAARRGRGRGRGRSRGRGRGREDEGERPMSLRRKYKIQDVIRRRQVMLVQVVKEERGNKGAALTTYLSLAGRYCVLMPNTMHGGGISRKISSSADRRKLKAMIDELQLPPSMGCIVRTAGLQRTKTEIKRDFDYLARLWDEIREKTLSATAPERIHSDSDLIKRAIRDIYHRDIDEVLVEGDEGYKAAKEFMKLLMPSHARRVKQYADPVSLYQRYGVEDQLAGMLNPVVQLKSGGYLVINPTEALVSIDINSGRSTREHNIEQTALSTNLEAAHEIARQLRLRDMAGLVVIDFIDMDHGSNVRKVERAMKDALKNDRARIQIGRISGFGLMEMSRQRLRTGVLEASTRPCPHCEGTGLVRTASSAGLSALRLIEEEAARGRGSRITLRASNEATFYLLNEKRAELTEIESLYGVVVEILPDGQEEGARMAVESSGPPPVNRPKFERVIEPEEDEDDGDDEAMDSDDEDGEEPARRDGAPRDEDGEERRRRKRRRRGRRGRREEGGDDARDGAAPSDRDDAETEADAEAADEQDRETATETGEGAREPRRRRRGGRGRGRRDDAGAAVDANADVTAEPAETADEAGPSDDADSAKPRTRRRPASAKAKADAARATDNVTTATATSADDDATPAKPKRASRAKKPATEPVASAADADSAEAAEKPRRRARSKTAATDETAKEVAAAPAPATEAETDKPARARRPRAKAADAVTADATSAREAAPTPSEPVSTAPASPAPESDPGDAATDEAGSPRRGWWQRTFGA